jgi:RNA-directed DNA polymerase
MVAKFYDINWKKAEKELFENQTLLLKAYINNDQIKLLNIQNKIVRSFSARAIAVKKITANNWIEINC